MRKWLWIWLIAGVFYFALEGLWRFINGTGQAHVSMLAVGGLCCCCVGAINQIPRFYTMPVIFQAVIGTGIVLAVEFIAGVVLNIWLGLGIWDYSQIPFNIAGQICLPFGLLWLLIMPFAIWFEDAIRWALWREGEPYTLRSIYQEFFGLEGV